jgi:peptidyl-prolyl cis-trans isomerase SurA
VVSVPKNDKGVNVGLEEEAKAKAEAARKRVLAGEAFEQVAAEVSSSGSRANGGLVGPLNVSELSAAFVDLLKTLQPGDVSEVLRVADGYQIIKLESQTADEVLTPEQAHDRIADAIFEQKRQVQLKKYLEKLRSEATIEWKNQEIRKAWLSRVQPAATPTPETSPAPEKPPTN